MTWIPDGRTDENYNQKYLNKMDKEFLRGFDWCVEMAADNFFDNNLIGFDDDDYLEHVLSEEVPEFMQEEYTMDCTFGGDVKTVTREIKTYADLLRYRLLEWIEMERDQLITSIIDGMEEEEYLKIRAEVDGQSEGEN